MPPANNYAPPLKFNGRILNMNMDEKWVPWVPIQVRFGLGDGRRHWNDCGDGTTLNQTVYLVPNSGPGNFGTAGNQPGQPSSRVAVLGTIHLL